MADEKSPESGSNPVANWLKTRVSRRGFGKAVASGAAGAAAGFGIGREVEYRHENPNEVTDEPWEIQIRRLELKGKQEVLLKLQNLDFLLLFQSC